MSVRITRKALVIVGVLAAVFAGTTAYAAIPDGGGVIHGCYDKASGVVRVTDTATNTPKACTTKEAALDWNQKGPKGDPGAPGSSDGYVVKKDMVYVHGGTQVASVYVPAGSYLLSVKLQGFGAFTTHPMYCTFGAGADVDTGSADPGNELVLSTAHTFDLGGWVTLGCNAQDVIYARYLTLTALKVGELHVS